MQYYRDGQQVRASAKTGAPVVANQLLQPRLAEFRFAESNRVKVGENIVMHFTQEDLSILFQALRLRVL